MLPPLPPPPWERESAPSAARVPSISRRWEMFKKIVPPPAPEREFKSNLLASTYKFLLSDRWFISTSQGLLKRYHSKERKKERWDFWLSLSFSGLQHSQWLSSAPCLHFLNEFEPARQICWEGQGYVSLVWLTLKTAVWRSCSERSHLHWKAWIQ